MRIDHREGLEKQANAIWKSSHSVLTIGLMKSSKSRGGRIKTSEIRQNHNWTESWGGKLGKAKHASSLRLYDSAQP